MSEPIRSPAAEGTPVPGAAARPQESAGSSGTGELGAAPTNGSGAMAPPGWLERSKVWWTRPRMAVAVLALLFLFNWWDTRRQVDHLAQEVAQRLKTEGEAMRQQGALAREAQERVREAVTKLAALEARLADSQSQQTALEALYQDLSRNRDDWALTEIEQTLTLASQQLQLAGNVRGALIALQNADLRLGRADKAQFISVRRALQRDIERLKGLPFVDTSGLALRLDAVIAAVDALPLQFDERLQPQSAARAAQRQADQARAQDAAAGGAEPKGSRDGKAAEPTAFARLRDDAWQQFLQLIRIRDIGDAEPVLLSPNQAFFVRENLKLRLLNARIALLQRNEALFRSDLEAAIGWINRYVDVRSRNGAAAVASLRALSGSAVSIELPNLSESLNAVRNFRAPRAAVK